MTDKFLHILRNPILQLAAFTIIGLLIRIDGLPYISGDMRAFLLPWFEEVKNGGASCP